LASCAAFLNPVTTSLPTKLVFHAKSQIESAEPVPGEPVKEAVAESGYNNYDIYEVPSLEEKE